MAYGYEIFNAAGTKILASSDRVGTVIVTGSVSLTTGSGGFPPYSSGWSSDITCTDMTTTNTNEIVVFLYDAPVPVASFSTNGCSIQRDTGAFRLAVNTYQPSTTYTVNYVAVRY